MSNSVFRELVNAYRCFEITIEKGISKKIASELKSSLAKN